MFLFNIPSFFFWVSWNLVIILSLCFSLNSCFHSSFGSADFTPVCTTKLERIVVIILFLFFFVLTYVYSSFESADFTLLCTNRLGRIVVIILFLCFV